ncbi:MAG: hypothetical protein ACYTFH_07835, partial [Planctomycetota bacterium]
MAAAIAVAIATSASVPDTAASAGPQASIPDAAPPSTGSLWERLDHDRFVERLGSLDLERTLEALEATEPAADEIER